MRKALSCLILFWLCAGQAHAATMVHENMVCYRLHLGMGVGDYAVSTAAMRTFLDAEISPAFPDGFTIIEARGQWRSAEHGLIRERTVLIEVYCADNEASRAAIEAVALKYVERFKAAKASLFVTRMTGLTSTLFY